MKTEKMIDLVIAGLFAYSTFKLDELYCNKKLTKIVFETTDCFIVAEKETPVFNGVDGVPE